MPKLNGVDIKKYSEQYSIANTIAMGSTAHKHVYVVVEGETDEAFFSELIGSGTRFQVGYGKPRVVAIMKLLNGYGVAHRAFGIVDADYWPLTGDKPDLPNLFVTDTPDVESLVVKSEAFRKTVKNYCNSKFIEGFLCDQGLEDPAAVRDILVKGAAKLGYLRYMSQKEKKSIDFKDLDFASFVDLATLQLDEQRLGEVLERSGKSSRTLVEGWLDGYAEQAGDPWKFACGHDIVSLMVVALRETELGWRENRDTYNKDDIEAGLRQAYETRHFRETCLCQDIEEWSNRVRGGSLVNN
jgi:hypothetical protein